jgi:arylsulfatase A-like enzyme
MTRLLPLLLAILAVPSLWPTESTIATGVSFPQGGSTLVAKGNSKGQSFQVAETGKLEGFQVQAGRVNKAASLTVEIFQATKEGFPEGKALLGETSKLPAKLKAGTTLQLTFSKPVELEPGHYVLVLRTEDSNMQLTLTGGDAYAGGSLVRNHTSTKGTWAKGNGSSDLAFRLLGDFDIFTKANASPSNPGKIAPETREVKLVKHQNPVFEPHKLSDIRQMPNIITIMADDLGWNQIGVPQGTFGTNPAMYKTPNLSRIAKGGMSFTHAYAQPNCAPTRAAMLSGQYPARIHNDVYVVGSLNRYGGGGISKQAAKFTGPEQTEDVAPEAVTVAEAMKENGYATAHIGKFHVGGHGKGTLPEEVGFDINIGGFSQGHQPVCFASKGKGGGWAFKGLGRGDFDRFAEPYTEAYLEKHNFPQSLRGTPKHVSDAIGDAAEETLGKLARTGKPFYLQLHTYAVHGPVVSRPDLLEDAGGDHFVGFVRSIDIVVGRVLAAIEDPNGDGDKSDSLAANTLLLITSDNGGTHKDNFPLRGKKGMFTEGGIRVPLVAYWPGVVPADTLSNHLVHSVDYYPTYLALAGKKWMPNPETHPLDGSSFADVLLDPNTQVSRPPIFYLFPGYLDSRATPCLTAIDKVDGSPHKLFYFYEKNAWELYALDDDISESKNLVEGKPEIAKALSEKIQAWLAQEHPTWKPKYPISKVTGKPAGPPPNL